MFTNNQIVFTPRSFDPMKGEHPAQFVVDSWSNPGIYEPLKAWVMQKIPTFCMPGSSTVPVPWILKHGLNACSPTSLCGVGVFWFAFSIE